MYQIYTQIIKEAIARKISDPEKFLSFKKNFFSLHRLPQPTNADLREAYEKMIAEKSILRQPFLEKALLSRKIRTQSGVAVIAVITKPYPCPGKCVYCPSEKGMPKSYLSNEPAVMRAITSKFDPYLQTQNRLRSLHLNGHLTDKIELIVMGGTFSYFPKNYQRFFIAECFRACNDYPRQKISPSKNHSLKSLFKIQNENEKARNRVIGLTLETRPDYIDEKEVLNFRLLGCTRVELGVQSIFDEILKENRRGHSVSAIVNATKLLKETGFKIGYHMMPGLLGSSLKKDYAMFQKLFTDENFQPDMLKIYPTVVTADSQLHKLWQEKIYQPMNEKRVSALLLRVKNEIIPPYVRISRLIRDVPENSILAGPKCSNLRQDLEKFSRCQCIRCREVRNAYSTREQIILDRIDYSASDGREIFLQFVSPDKRKLFALLRLRIPPKSDATHFIPILRQAALIREVHTYGKLIGLKEKNIQSPQHSGLGKKLLQEAEKIARLEFGLKKMAVISGIGARAYYRKLGYRQKESYMLKKL